MLVFTKQSTVVSQRSSSRSETFQQGHTHSENLKLSWIRSIFRIFIFSADLRRKNSAANSDIRQQLEGLANVC